MHKLSPCKPILTRAHSGNGGVLEVHEVSARPPAIRKRGTSLQEDGSRDGGAQKRLAYRLTCLALRRAAFDI